MPPDSNGDPLKIAVLSDVHGNLPAFKAVLEAVKAEFGPSRVGWERIEPIAGLVEQIDGGTITSISPVMVSISPTAARSATGASPIAVT